MRTARLVSVTSSRSAPTVRKCYYYHHFVYYRVSDLAGVVFATPRGARLYVNPLGHTVSEFQHSLLYRTFGHACVDPTQLKDPDEVLFVDFSIDRSSDRARWEHLRQRYGLMTSVMQEHSWHGYASLDGLTDADEQSTYIALDLTGRSALGAGVVAEGGAVARPAGQRRR